MGQITSFILLCLANAACTLAAFNLHGIEGEAAWSRFIINGDDRLARSSVAIEDTFWMISSSIGLCRSPGKSHEDHHFACINSQMYWKDARGKWSRIQVLRSTLLHGIMKLSTDEFKPSHVVTALFDQVPTKCRARAVAFYLATWGEKIREECAGRNLFLPVALNGMGQTPPDEWEWHITEKQAAVAYHLMKTQPYLSWDFGPQWPSPPVSAHGSSQPWDQAVASRDAGSLEEELAQFRKREGFRVSRALMQRNREAWCCGEVRESDCPSCGRQFGYCDQAQPHVEMQTTTCRCDWFDGIWDRAREQRGPMEADEAGGPLPCPHRRKKAVVTWSCPCHGVSMEWRTVERKVKQTPISRTALKSAVRPTLTYRRHHEADGEPRLPPRAVTWGADPSNYMSVKTVPIADETWEARMRIGIEVAIAEATGDWRGLV